MTEEVPSVRSVALGLWVRTGSRNETPAQAGVSHFLEHLLFKGTARYSAIEISERFDGLGASVNAATGKETTHLHARFLDEHTEEVFDLLAEMLLAPTYPERSTPSARSCWRRSRCTRTSRRTASTTSSPRRSSATHPLGRRVLGEAEVIASIPIPDIEAYHHARYTGANIVVGAAGHLDHDRDRRARRAPRQRRRPTAAESAPDGRLEADGAALLPREGHRAVPHLLRRARASRRDDERRYPLARPRLDLRRLDLLAPLPRGAREARPRLLGRLLQRAVHRPGLVATYVGTREDNVEEACAIIGAELARLRSEPVSDEELARAKESVKGRLVLSSESTAARMTRISPARRSSACRSKASTRCWPRSTRSTVDDLTELAAELYGAGAPLGGLRRRATRSCFRKALAPVSESLVAA